MKTNSKPTEIFVLIFFAALFSGCGVETKGTGYMTPENNKAPMENGTKGQRETRTADQGNEIKRIYSVSIDEQEGRSTAMAQFKEDRLFGANLILEHPSFLEINGERAILKDTRTSSAVLAVLFSPIFLLGSGTFYSQVGESEDTGSAEFRWIDPRQQEFIDNLTVPAYSHNLESLTVQKEATNGFEFELERLDGAKFDAVIKQGKHTIYDAFNRGKEGLIGFDFDDLQILEEGEASLHIEVRWTKDLKPGKGTAHLSRSLPVVQLKVE